VLVAAGKEVLVFDDAGALVNRYPANPAISALAHLRQSREDSFIVGYPNGGIELLSTSKSTGETKASAFSQVPSSKVLRILIGPRNTIIVGYANGVVGIWDLSDGARLAHARVHGPVVHMLLEEQRLYVASDLGGVLVWDLSAFYREYCDLLQQVWQRVPVVWEKGRPELRPPADHRCQTP